jgi:2-oxoglutarate ferredoxin oxidoreductase subunit alpha
MGLEFLEGNEAVVRGALRAKCDFFAGYPITPSSTILQYMLEVLPRVGGIGIQAEDEIASIGFCIGAAMAGRKVLTATSGPGISLYSENIGLAIMGETPMVIVNVQRQGPATGSATKGAEGDILFTRWVTSGGLPVIVLSPATVGESYELSYRAFNLAEQYRLPVFLLSNKEIGMTRESVDLDAIELPPLVARKRPSPERAYLPHDFETPTEVPAISDFGGERIARYTTSTHDKAKVEGAADDIALVKEDFQKGAGILVLSYGVTSRSAQVAVRKARSAGVKVSSLTLQTLYPVPEKAITAAMKGIEKVIVPEMNTGQYILEVERLAPAGVDVVGVNKMDTTLISPAEISEQGGLS